MEMEIKMGQNKEPKRCQNDFFNEILTLINVWIGSKVSRNRFKRFRYGKIIIMTDVDVDGSISELVVNFLLINLLTS